MSQRKMELRDRSRLGYTIDADSLSLDQIKTGCLLRIADSMEASVKQNAELLKDRERLYNELEHYKNKCKQQKREITTLRGQNTRFRKQINTQDNG